MPEYCSLILTDPTDSHSLCSRGSLVLRRNSICAEGTKEGPVALSLLLSAFLVSRLGLWAQRLCGCKARIPRAPHQPSILLPPSRSWSPWASLLCSSWPHLDPSDRRP